ncbi:MAG: PAS domain S-box protein [Anaerolineae bacterium]|nr:PAS domain S-box protein [Anaerolineae bacterium]
MSDTPPADLLQELARLRQRVAELEAVQVAYRGLLTQGNWLSLLVEHGPCSVMVTDRDGTIEYVNPHFTELTGYPIAEAIGQNPRFLKSGLTPQETYASLWQTIGSGQVWQGEFINRKKNQQVFWEKARIAPLMDETGSITHFIAIIEDISAQKATADELAKCEQALHALHETALAVGLERDMPTLLQGIMNRAVKLLDADRGGGIYLYDPEQDTMVLAAGAGINQNRIGLALPLTKGVAGQVFQTAQPLIVNNYTHWMGRGEVIVHDPPSAVMGVPLKEHDHILGALAVFADSQRRCFNFDDINLAEMFAAYAGTAIQNARSYSLLVQEISERRQAEQALRESEIRYRLLAENATDVIWTLTPEGRFSYVSPSVERLRGYTPEEVMQQPLHEALTSQSLALVEARLLKMMAVTASGKRYTGSECFELEQPCKDGSTVWTEVAISVLYDGDQVSGVLGVARDISERKQAEQRRLDWAVERERASILSRFIQDAAHEFRNPMAVINTQLYLWDKSRSTEQAAQRLAIIKAENRYLSRLVESMLTMARLDSGVEYAAAPLDVSLLLREVMNQFRPLAAAAQIELTGQAAPDLPRVPGDRPYLHQAVTNLLDNAIRYTPAGGRIDLHAEHSDDSLHITVTDTGVGISAEHLPHIFARFYRSDTARTDRGVGLGLSIALRIVEGHGGRIAVASTPDQGSTFTIILPLHHPDRDTSLSIRPAYD